MTIWKQNVIILENARICSYKLMMQCTTRNHSCIFIIDAGMQNVSFQTFLKYTCDMRRNQFIPNLFKTNWSTCILNNDLILVTFIHHSYIESKPKTTPSRAAAYIKRMYRVTGRKYVRAVCVSSSRDKRHLIFREIHHTVLIYCYVSFTYCI